MTLAPGSKLGPYEITDLLGAGGMGEVYRARDTRLGRPVAVKMIRGLAAGDTERLRRFELEARTAGILNHPNILAIHDVGEHEGAPYLVSELLEGETLRRRLAGGALSPTRAVECAVQIASGLAAAHARGIVHRDLKPDNVFLTRDGRVKILDFGLAKLAEVPTGSSSASLASTVDSPTEPGQFVGTVNYMSPEGIRGLPVDHRSDIFAFGAVLYEMLTGRRAFERASPIETMNAALKEEPPEADVSTWPRGLDLIVHRCLEKDPEHRFHSANDLAFHLLTLSSSPLTGPWPGGPPPRPPRRGLALAAAAVVALVGAGGYLVGHSLARPSPPTYQQLTFRRGAILSARFAPDGRTIVYGAAWEGRPFQLYSTRAESPESRSLDLPDGDILAISPTGEMAIGLGRRYTFGSLAPGTLARVPLVGGAPREVLTDVHGADWSPDGRQLAVVRVVGGRYRLEYPIGTVLLESAGWISHPRVSPDGRRVAVIDHRVNAEDRGVVAVVDPGGQTRVLTREWSSANGLAWAKGGDEIWFTAAEQGPNCALRAVSLSGKDRLLMRSGGRLALHDVRRDGHALLTDGKFRIGMAHVDVAQKRQRDLSWLQISMVTDLSRDGRTLLFSEVDATRPGAYALYARKADGSPAVRLGDGLAAALAPDGRHALSVVDGSLPHLVLWPAGAGESRSLKLSVHVDEQSVNWMPDGRRILFAGRQGGDDSRLYLQELEGGDARPASPPGLRIPLFAKPISPDGRSVAAVDAQGRPVVQDLNGAEPRPVAGLESGDLPIRWAADGASLYVHRIGELPGRIFRLDLATGRKTPLTELLPADAAGVGQIITVQVTADGRACAYSYKQNLSDLYLVGGLR